MPSRFHCDDCNTEFNDQRIWSRHIQGCAAVTNDLDTFGQQMLRSIANSNALQALQHAPPPVTDDIDDSAPVELIEVNLHLQCDKQD
jgi:hypothetical protein